MAFKRFFLTILVLCVTLFIGRIFLSDLADESVALQIQTETSYQYTCDTDMECYEECVQIGGKDCE